MDSLATSLVIGLLLCTAVLTGRRLRRYMPAHHLSADSREAVRTAMGIVATMSALLLGLLVASAKSSYDNQQGQVLQMAGKVAFLERVLSAYGPEAEQPRKEFCLSVEHALKALWSNDHAQNPSGVLFFEHLQALTPHDDAQRTLKAQASSLAIDLGQLRASLEAEAAPSISMTMLIIVVGWLCVTFMSVTLLAPPNATTTLAALIAAISVAGAMLLIFELDRPFGGLIQISSQPILNALNAAARAG